MRQLSFALALVFAALAVQTLEAQETGPRFSVEAAGFYGSIHGDDFEGTDGALGFDGQLRAAFSALSIGLGYQRSSHGVDFGPNVVVGGLFVEPRYSFAPMGRATPFILGRVARLTAKQKITDEEFFFTLEAERPGWGLGAGAGLEVGVGPAAHLVFSGSYNHLSFGDVKVFGIEIPGTDGSGSSIMLRAGFNYRFGNR